jgi:hypothetical protein
VRSVIEDSRVSRAIDDAKLKWPRAGDAWDAVVWVIARDPSIGRPLTESGNVRSFTFDGAKSIGLPTVTVLYEVQHIVIVVHDALFQEPTFAQAGRA